MTGNLYTHNMSTQANVIPLKNDARELRRARGRFVHDLIKADGRSNRYVANQIGLNPTSMGERLSGKSPFLADELEGIARVLKKHPVDFYQQYIAVGPGGFEPPTSTVESGHLAEILPFARKAA